MKEDEIFLRNKKRCFLAHIEPGAVGEVSTPRSTFCADSYLGVRSSPMLLQQHVKDPGQSAKSAGGTLQLNTHAPFQRGFE